MKKIATLVVFVLALTSQAIAAQLSTLNLRTSSNIPIKVILDGQLISENNSLASINNIPAGYHDLQVFYSVQDYFGIREEVLFFGKVLLPANTITNAFINEQQQYVIEEQLAIQVPQHYGHGNYAHNSHNQHYDNQYGTKPVFWSTQGAPKPVHCGTIAPQQIIHAPVVETFPMHKNAFNQLKNAIDKQWFSDGKMTVFNQALASNYFTAQQVNELINLFSFSKDRLEVAKRAYSKTLDQANYFIVYESLHWNSSIQNLSNYIASL